MRHSYKIYEFFPLKWEFPVGIQPFEWMQEILIAPILQNFVGKYLKDVISIVELMF